MNGLLGNFGQNLGASLQDPATRERLALAFNSMRLNPDQNLAQSIGQRQQQRQTADQKNRTVQYLRQRGREDLAAAVESGALDAKTAATQLFAQPESTAMQRNYEFLVGQGMTPEQALGAVRSGTTINMPGAPEMGTIPQGYQAVRDPDTGSYRLERMAGGPAEAEAQAAASQRQEQQALGSRAGNVVLEDIRRVQKIAQESNIPIAGPIGSVLAKVPGTNAYDVSALAQTIRANIGFDRLQQMRDASPTGGALGQVSNQEIATLQSVLGNLDQSQSQEQFEYNLRRIGDLYTGIMQKFAAYPNAADFGIQAPASPAAGNRIRYNERGERTQ